MIGLLQLSDIHFAFKEGALFDVDRELQRGVLRFLPEVRSRVGEIGLITVCGDVAYHGTAEEYATASGFLREVRSTLGDPRIPVRVIPGNHDIHRPSTKGATQRNWRSGPRMTRLSADQRNSRLVALLQEASSGAGLMKPLTAYNDFAATFGCSTSATLPLWTAEYPINDRWILRLRGLNSVLLSDAHDDEDKLVLGSFQLSDLEPEPGFVNVTLCHHPFTWLLDGKAQKARVKRRSQLHITGHVHQHSLRVDGDNIHLGAGALQPPRGDRGWKPRFNAVGLEVIETGAGAALQVKIVAAVWKAGDDSFVLDGRNSVTKSVPLQSLQTPPPTGTIVSPAIERLLERLALLPFADQVQVALQLKLSLGEVVDRPTRDIPAHIVEASVSRGLLPDLWDAVEERHGGQDSGSNPFSGGDV